MILDRPPDLDVFPLGERGGPLGVSKARLA